MTALLLVPGIIAICTLIAWIAWLRFNERMYKATGDPGIFNKTTPVAKSFRQSSVAASLAKVVPRLFGLGKDQQSASTVDGPAPPVPNSVRAD